MSTAVRKQPILTVRPARPLLTHLFVLAYKIRLLRPLIRRALRYTEGGLIFSPSWRQIMLRHYGVMLGDFSYGPTSAQGVFPPGTQIGNYCSFADGLQILRRNHPLGRFSQHPLFFNHILRVVPEDTIPPIRDNALRIGSDVWVGANVVICPGCREIGDGAIIAAGAVVTRDVPAFTIAGGIPAHVIRKRFDPQIEAAVAASKWWLRPLPEILEHLDLFAADITEDSLRKFTSAFADGGQAASDTSDSSHTCNV